MNRRSISAGNPRYLMGNKDDNLQLQLLMSEESFRSELMYRQIEAFEEKVDMCFERFDVTLFYSMVRQLSQQSSVYDIDSVQKLRQVYDDEMARSNGINISHQQLNQCLQYFTWFCKFLTYLRNLWISFNTRIFVPLFKYFLHNNPSVIGSDRRGSTSSTLSKFSNVSFASSESGIMSDCGDSERVEEGEDNIDDSEAIARLRYHSHTALMLLSEEFKDIKTLYDTSEIKKLAQKLSFVKEQLEFNMDEDEIIDPGLLSERSAMAVKHLNADDELDSLLRYVPDILFKFRTASNLARKWLEIDEKRSLDFKSKLEKVVQLEEKMTRRLSSLVMDIKQHEDKLEQDSEELQKLLQREERSTELSAVVYDLDEKVKAVQDRLRQLRKEKVIITNKLVQAVKRRMKSEYKTQKVLYESNRLKRYSSERQLATLQFRRDLAEADMYVEIGVKPHLIRSTNDLQDRVEQLEKIIEEEKREESTIKSALIPVQNDRECLSKIVHPNILPQIIPKSTAQPKPILKSKVTAHYVGSRNVAPGRANHVKTYRGSKLPVLIRKSSVGVQTNL